MPNPELVERVARAIWKQEGWHHFEPESPDTAVYEKWEDQSNATRDYAFRAAQAALKAHSDWLAEQGLVVVPEVSGTVKYKQPRFKVGDRVNLFIPAEQPSEEMEVLAITYEKSWDNYIVALTRDGKTCCGTISQDSLYRVLT